MCRVTETRKRRRKQEGFTLLELLVVLVILGLVTAFAAPQVIKYMAGAKTDSAGIQIERLSGILDLYRLEVGRYPEELEALVVEPADAKGWNGPYVKKESALDDPWGRSYIYRFPGEFGEFDLYTLGGRRHRRRRWRKPGRD